MEPTVEDNPFPPAWHFSGLPLRSRAFFGLGGLVAYSLVFLALLPYLGDQTGFLSLVPVLAGSLLFGMWGGLVASALVVSLDLGLLVIAGRGLPPGVPGLEFLFWVAILAGCGAIFGRTRDFGVRLERALAARQQAEAGLEEAQDRYRAFFEGVPVGLYRTTPDGRILDASPALVEMLAYPDLETLKQVYAHDLFVRSDERLQQRDFMDQEGVVHGYEVQLRRFDGRLIWVRDNFRAVRDASGQILYFDGSLEDITGRKEMEEALQDSRERFYISVETMLDGFAILSAARDERGQICDFHYEYINEAGCQMDGYSREEHNGRTLREIVPEVERLHLLDAFVQVVESGRPFARDALIFELEAGEGEGEPGAAPSFRAMDVRATKLGDGVAVTWREVTERQAVERAEREQRILAEALRDTAAALGSTLEYEEVLDRILTNIGKVVPHDAANIMVLDGDSARLERSQGYIDNWQPGDRLTTRFPLARMPTLRQMFETGKPLAIPDTHHHPDWVVTPHSGWMRSYAGAPVRLRGQILGFLNLNSATAGFFTPAKAERLQAFADQAAVAIENARFFGELQSFARRMALLNDITRASLSAPDLKVMLQHLADQLGELIGADGAYILLWDAQRGQPVPVAAYGPHRQNFPNLRIEPGEANMTSSVLGAGRALVAEETIHSPYISPRLAAHHPEGSLLGLPMIVDGRPLGAVLLAFEQRHPFTGDEIAIGEQAAAQVALAISKAQLFESERQRTAQLARANTLITALGRVATRVSTAPDLDRLIEILGTELKQLEVNCLVALQALETASISVHYLSIGEEALALAEQLAGTEIHDRLLSPEQMPYAAEVIEERRAVFSADLSRIPGTAFPGLPDGLEAQIGKIMGAEEGSRGFFLPLVAGENSLGALWMWGPELDENDLPAASLFAGQVAVALENARLYRRIQDLAIRDELTGLYNRRGMFEVGRREAERAARFDHPLSALLIDIDHFKRVNDTYGHTIGDQVLRAFADCCRRNVREVDVVGRMGGEEFIILLPEADLANTRKAAERLLSRILETGFETEVGEVHLTASIGVAEYNASSQDLDELYRQADEALYKAKNSGRNQVAASVSALIH
jgi:diguanylate cyclase (GGDEF)-like protein/PAS domain S-box-containing protein